MPVEHVQSEFIHYILNSKLCLYRVTSLVNRRSECGNTELSGKYTHDATAYLPLSELVDLAAERERIAKELEKAKNGLRITEGKLANEKFVAHAPENVVNAEREKVAKYQELIAKLEESAKAMA